MPELHQIKHSNAVLNINLNLIHISKTVGILVLNLPSFALSPISGRGAAGVEKMVGSIV